MKHFEIVAFTLVITLALAATAASALAGVPWTKIDSAADRFELTMDDDAVIDHETGLVWERHADSNGAVTWIWAHNKCLERKTGGRMGWRLPTVAELASLYESRGWAIIDSPALPGGHPFLNVRGTAGSAYWTSTLQPRVSDDDPDEVYVVTFRRQSSNRVGRRGRQSPGGGAAFTWCVRGDTGATSTH